jgi:short subunit dehydrogenase-like uncharacterized protein
MSDQIWVLGATGRSGRGIAELLHASGHKLVLAGRDPSRLRALADRLGGADTATGSLDALLTQLRDAAPAVVVNTVGPFARTTARVIEACPPGTHYVDIANELPAFEQALAQHDAAVDRGSTLVTGAGFGVLATESLVARMCERWPGPARVRVDAIASLAVEEGLIGSALAGSILDGLPDGGRQVERGRLVRAALAGQRQRLTTPDGDAVTTTLLPTGDLLAAWRTSGAGSVVSGSAMLPGGPVVRALLPAVSLLARASVLRHFAVDRLAKVRIRAQRMERRSSWGHCAMEWPDGTRREGWLRLGDAGEFTNAATAEVARRLAGQDVAAGAYTPAALFGPSLAVDLGGEFVI